MALAALTALMCLAFYKLGHSRINISGKIPVLSKVQTISLMLLIMFIFLVVTSTIFTRLPTKNPHYTLEIFWSWKNLLAHRNIKLLKQILLNCVLLFPMGFLLPFVCGRKIRPSGTFAVGFLFSFSIEVGQLITHRGLFEFDDMLHNALGCLVGCIFANYIHSLVTQNK